MAYIGLDVGHGTDTWETGGGKGVKKNGKVYEEHDFNSKIAKATKSLLEAQGHKVTYGVQQPNSKDTSLSSRTNKFNALGVDFVISMHANAGAESVDGRCVFYWHDHAQSKKLAENIVKAIHDKGYSTHGNGLHASMTGSWTNLHMVRETKMTAILIEYGFMTNDKDFEYIFGSKQNQYVKDMAEATVKGVQAYLGLNTSLKANKPTVTPSKPTTNTSTGIVKKYAENGVFYPNETIIVRDAPTTKANIVARYHKGENLTYHTVHIGNGYVWLEYLRNNGKSGFIPIREYKNGKFDKLWGTIK